MMEEENTKSKKSKAQVEFTGANKIWNEQGTQYRLRDNNKRVKKLERAIYTLEADIFGFYLEKIEPCFSFDHKIYGLEASLIQRVLKTYAATKGNLGVLLNGVKGTGKTVTAKILCNKLDLPIILVPKSIEGCHFFLNGIPQDIIIFIDEYEKVFKDAKDSSDMLTIMDGALNSEYRRVFVLTTNQLYINENLIQRPGRIRYLKTFSDLHPNVIEEIVDDRLKHKKHKNAILAFISSLEIITVDIVNSIIDEVNIHNEAPNSFKDVFNVKKISGKHNVYLLNTANNTSTEIYKNVKLYPNRFDVSEDSLIGYHLSVNDVVIGTIVEVISKNVLKIEKYTKGEPTKRRSKHKISSDSDETPESGVNLISMEAYVDEISDKNTKNKKADLDLPSSFIVRIEDAETTNWKYKYAMM